MNRVGVVIGASADTIHAINVAQKYGVFIYALDGNPKAAGFGYADKAIVVDISDIPAVCRVIEEIHPDYLLPIPIGKYLSTIGYINEKYNLPGVRYNATKNSADKYMFHSILNTHRLRDIELQLVNRDKMGKSIQYPAIMKPRYGSGSRDVFYITNDEELSVANESLFMSDEDFVLEQACVGEEYSMDGAVIDGELYITLIRRKTITPLPVRQPVASYSVDYNDPIYCRVKNKIQLAVNVLEYDNCLVNADMIVNSDEVFIIEMAPRPSGHSMHSVFVPLTTGVDMIEEYIKYMHGEEYCFIAEKVKKMKINFFDFEDVIVREVPSREQLEKECNLVCWNCCITENNIMCPVTNGASIMNRGYFIVSGDSDEQLDWQSDFIKNQFRVEDI